MSAIALSSRQREILEALADYWVLQRWRCNDGRRCWHLGEDEVDGRAVRGLLRRRLIAWDAFDPHRLVLTAAGWRAVRESPSAAPGASESGWVALGVTYTTVSGVPDASVDDQQADWSQVERCPTCRCCSIGRMGTCVGGCEPNGDRREHDRQMRAETDATPASPAHDAAGEER